MHQQDDALEIANFVLTNIKYDLCIGREVVMAEDVPDSFDAPPVYFRIAIVKLLIGCRIKSFGLFTDCDRLNNRRSFAASGAGGAKLIDLLCPSFNSL